jgi:hypothetical protein
MLTLYALVAAASGLVSLWSAVRQPVTNPDGALYLTAAEYFASSSWAAGRAMYRWPAYSLLISAVMRLGVDAFVAAQILNAILDAALAILLVDVVRRLAPGDRILPALAAVLVLLSPRLLQLHPAVVRDHGYLAFYVLALDLLVRDFSAPSAGKKLGIAAAVVGAAAFRVEALYLFVLIPGFYLCSTASTRWRRAAVVAACFGTGLVLPFAYYLKDDLLLRLVDPASHRPWPPVLSAFDAVVARVQVLRGWAPGSEWQAFIGLVLGILVLRGIRGVGTLVFAISLLAFTRPVRERHAFALRLMVWLTVGQLLIVLAYLCILLDMDLRYVLNIALFSTIGVALVLRELIRRWSRPGEGVSRSRWALPAIAVALLASVWNAVPRGAPLQLKEAGEWIRTGLSPDDTLLTNDIRILYYARRLTAGAPPAVDPGAADVAGLVKWAQYDYVAVNVPRDSVTEQRLRQQRPRPERIIGNGPWRVLIFETGRAQDRQ